MNTQPVHGLDKSKSWAEYSLDHQGFGLSFKKFSLLQPGKEIKFCIMEIVSCKNVG